VVSAIETNAAELPESLGYRGPGSPASNDSHQQSQVPSTQSISCRSDWPKYWWWCWTIRIVAPALALFSWLSKRPSSCLAPWGGGAPFDRDAWGEPSLKLHLPFGISKRALCDQNQSKW